MMQATAGEPGQDNDIPRPLEYVLADEFGLVKGDAKEWCGPNATKKILYRQFNRDGSVTGRLGEDRTSLDLYGRGVQTFRIQNQQYNQIQQHYQSQQHNQIRQHYQIPQPHQNQQLNQNQQAQRFEPHTGSSSDSDNLFMEAFQQRSQPMRIELSASHGSASSNVGNPGHMYTRLGATEGFMPASQPMTMMLQPPDLASSSEIPWDHSNVHNAPALSGEQNKPPHLDHTGLPMERYLAHEGMSGGWKHPCISSTQYGSLSLYQNPSETSEHSPQSSSSGQCSSSGQSSSIGLDATTQECLRFVAELRAHLEAGLCPVEAVSMLHKQLKKMVADSVKTVKKPKISRKRIQTKAADSKPTKRRAGGSQAVESSENSSQGNPPEAAELKEQPKVVPLDDESAFDQYFDLSEATEDSQTMRLKEAVVGSEAVLAAKEQDDSIMMTPDNDSTQATTPEGRESSQDRGLTGPDMPHDTNDTQSDSMNGVLPHDTNDTQSDSMNGVLPQQQKTVDEMDLPQQQKTVEDMEMNMSLFGSSGPASDDPLTEEYDGSEENSGPDLV